MLGVTFFMGLYAVYYGMSEIQVQRNVIREVQETEKKEFHQYLLSVEEELTSTEDKQKQEIATNPAFAWHRHGFHAILPPHDYAALAIGQRDLFPFFYRLTGMSLHYQLFQNELANPLKLYVGNFDLSFVIIYLFPLIIIAFTYSLYSGEKENGILPLLHIQSLSIRKILLIRLGVYFVLITFLAVIISFISLIVSGNIFSSSNGIVALAWIAGVVLYCAFWFGLLFFIISFLKNSAFNAIAAAGCWLLFLIVIPAVLNVVVTTKYPLNSTALAGLTRRMSLENEEDEQEALEVILEFLEHNPQLAGSDSLIHHNRLPKAYAAFTFLKDLNSKKEVDHYNGQVAKRNEWTSGFHWINPAVNLQDAFGRITRTDLETFLRFQASIAAFHKEITSFYFEKLFKDQPLRQKDYKQLPVFKMAAGPGSRTVVLNSLLKMVLLTSLLFLLAHINFGKSKKQ